MASWGEFEAAVPELAAAGRELLYQHDVGLAFLATTAPDGSPRVHPVCPLLHRGGIYVFVVPSPKQRDLRRDGRYALHSFPCEDNEDAVHLTGHARQVTDAALREVLEDQFVAERAAFKVPAPAPDHELFEFDLGRCLVTRTTGHGDPAPRHTVWRAP